MSLRPISPERRSAMLIDVHRAIASMSRETADLPPTWTPTYPPNVVLDNSERDALRAIAQDPKTRRALAKLIADGAALVVFRMLAVTDAVGDPEGWSGHWGPIILAECDENDTEHSEMLHDAFFDTYKDVATAT